MDIEEKCWKLHPKSNPNNCKKDEQKNMLSLDSSNQVEISFDVDENIVYTLMHKKVNLIILH
jgi:hypothetical protein